MYELLPFFDLVWYIVFVILIFLFFILRDLRSKNKSLILRIFKFIIFTLIFILNLLLFDNLNMTIHLEDAVDRKSVV